jgi:hypothetical protein
MRSLFLRWAREKEGPRAKNFFLVDLPADTVDRQLSHWLIGEALCVPD